MGERVAVARAIHLEHSFDRLHAAKLEQVYAILVPDYVRVAGKRGNLIGADDADGSDLGTGILRQAEGGEHDCQPDGSADRLRPRARIQRAR